MSDSARVNREAAVPRTTARTGGPDVARALAGRRRMAAGTWGMVMLIATEGMLFAAFIASWFYIWSRASEWPLGGIPQPDVLTFLVPAICLALASVPMQLAWWAGASGRARAACMLVASALVVQCGYAAFAIYTFTEDLDTFTPRTNAYGSLYYVLLGADHAHVLLGILFSAWLIAKLVRGLTTYRANALHAIAWYWHAVNLLTLVVVGVILSSTL